MLKSLLDILVDPISGKPFELDVHKCDEKGNILEGTLRNPDGASYSVTKGIPRFVLTEDSGQKQTGGSFGFKWEQRSTYESPRVHAAAEQWLIERYGFANIKEMRRFFSNRWRILDAGCGSGFTTSLWMNPASAEEIKAEWFGVDISLAIDVARERLGNIRGTHFVQADVSQLPFRWETFDTVYAEGVLHHTPSTELALKSLVSLLQPGGEILFYVYRKKGPIREFTDDYVRGIVSSLDPEEAWAVLRPLTRLGQAVAELHAQVEIPEDIPYLGIKAGRYDVQRLMYWHFAKLFWREGFSFEENHHVNFDWYHPRYAHRHTEDEIRRWCVAAGLSIFHFDAQESGFTVRAVKA